MEPETDKRIITAAVPPPPSPYTVHFVLLQPNDKPAFGYGAIMRTALHIQAWYQNQMGFTKPPPGSTQQPMGKTFYLGPRIATVYFRPHPSIWYSTHDTGGDHRGWYWENTLQDLYDACKGGFGTPYDDWVVYVDADPAPDQYAGGTTSGGSGVCVMGAKDIASLRGVDPDWTQCRGIGGSGHEFGHTFGLPHPPPGPDFGRAIMGTGYGIYPSCVLLPSDKATLNASPFFFPQRRKLPPANLCPF